MYATYFLDNPTGAKRVRFKDGNRDNLVPSNIEWIVETKKFKKKPGIRVEFNGEAYQTMVEASQKLEIDCQMLHKWRKRPESIYPLYRGIRFIEPEEEKEGE